MAPSASHQPHDAQLEGNPMNRVIKSMASAKPQRLQAIVVSALLACTVSPSSRAGDIAADMSAFFNQMGSLSTSTSAGAYKGQGMNVYMGGELQVRTPVRTYQLYNFSMPSIKAGCGGIDAYLGSFSHINKEQFKAMLQQIGDATVGLLFKAALAAINPLIESKLAELQEIASKYNLSNMNSCQMAQSLVNGMSGLTGMSSASTCVSMAKTLYNEDEAAARARCKADPVAVNTDAKSSANPDAKALAERSMNILWEALSGSTLTVDEKETLLNIAGSLITKPGLDSGDGKGGSPLPLDPSIDSLQVFLNGHEISHDDPTKVKIKGYWKCDDSACLAPTKVDKEILPFSQMVRAQLLSMQERMASRLELQPEHLALIRHTSIPVHRMLRLGYQAGSVSGSSVQSLFIERFAQIIALDYAHTFLTQAYKNVRAYTGAMSYKGVEAEKGAKDMRERLDNMIEAVDRQRIEALSRVANIDLIVTHMERTERALRQGLGGPSRDMLNFGALMAGKGPRG